VKVDLGAALAGGRLLWFLDHLVVRRSWLRGRVLVVANAAFIGDWNIAPRAHPGDGRLDILDTDSMSVSDRWKARRRLPAGGHVPHPDIRYRRPTAAQFDFDDPMPAWLDGHRTDAVSSLSVRLEPDAVDLWV
jgi:diacylglycerol kinase family enzyme